MDGRNRIDDQSYQSGGKDRMLLECSCPMGFDGFPAAVFEWFAGLEADNSRTYFAAPRDTYETAVRGGPEDLLDELGGTFGGKSRVFRQQRDLRFSPDKTPYKTRTYGLL